MFDFTWIEITLPLKLQLKFLILELSFIFKFIIQFDFTRMSLNTNYLTNNPFFAGVNFT